MRNRERSRRARRLVQKIRTQVVAEALSVEMVTRMVDLAADEARRATSEHILYDLGFQERWRKEFDAKAS